MDCAANHGHAKLIQLLVNNDAPIDAKDRSQVCIAVILLVLIAAHTISGIVW